MAIATPKRPNIITGALQYLTTNDETQLAKVQIGSDILELPLDALPRVPERTVVHLALSSTGNPDHWVLPRRSLRKLLDVSAEELKNYETLHPGADLTTEGLTESAMTLPVLAHNTVVSMLHQNHTVTYENLLQYPCTADAAGRNKARQEILQDPVLNAFLYRFGRSNMHLMLHFRYHLSDVDRQRLMHVLDLSVGLLTEYPYLTAYALDGAVIDFTVLDAIADVHQHTASLPDRIYAALFWAVQNLTFKQKMLFFSVEEAKAQAEKALKAYGLTYPTTVLGRTVASGSLRLALDQAWDDLVATSYVHSFLNAKGQQVAYVVRVKYAVHHSGHSAVKLATHPPMAPLGDLALLIQQLASMPYTLDPDQLSLVNHMLTQQLTVVTGGPGTGKTRLIASLVHALGQTANPPTVWVIAPTARAALRAQQETVSLAQQVPNHQMLTNTTFMTIHKALHMTPTTDGHPGRVQLPDLVIVDEFSMVDSILAHTLFQSAVAQHARLILVGDVAQLPPVGLGLIMHYVLRHSTGSTTVATLTQSHRALQNPVNPALDGLRQSLALHDKLITVPGWHSLSKEQKKQRFEQDRQAVLIRLQQASTVHWDDKISLKSFDARLMRTIREGRQLFPDVTPLILTPYRQARWMNANHLNGAVHKLLTGVTTITPGDPVIIRQNGQYPEHQALTTIYVPNGTLGTVSQVQSGQIVVTITHPEDISRQVEIELRLGGFRDIFDWGYVTTVHAAQGGQSPVVILIGSPKDAVKNPRLAAQWDPRMFYTALSRVQDVDSQLGHVFILGTVDFKGEDPDHCHNTFLGGWNKGLATP